MTTRGSLARGQGQQQFQGNVQKWVRQWVEPGTGPGSSKVALLKWVPTGDRSGSKPGPRFPHLQPVSNTNLKVPAGNKDNGKKPTPRQHQPTLSQPVAMDLDGDQLVSAGKMQQEETLSTELNLSRARETNGEAHIAPQQQINEGASELPSEESPAATSQPAVGTQSHQNEKEAASEVGQRLPEVAAEPIQTLNSPADTALQRPSSPAGDLASYPAAPAPHLDPEAQKSAAEVQPQQDDTHDSTEELQHAKAAETGIVADEKLPVLPSLGDDAPGQAPAGKDDKALTGPGAPGQAPSGRDGAAPTVQEAPDQAMAPEEKGTLVGDKAPSGGADEALAGPGMPSGAPEQAPVSIAGETAASAAALQGAVQLQQPAEGAPSKPLSLDEQPHSHSEPAVAALIPAKRPAEDVSEAMDLDAKRAKTGSGPE